MKNSPEVQFDSGAAAEAAGLGRGALAAGLGADAVADAGAAAEEAADAASCAEEACGAMSKVTGGPSFTVAGAQPQGASAPRFQASKAALSSTNNPIHQRAISRCPCLV
jgi:hypothetical protein